MKKKLLKKSNGTTGKRIRDDARILSGLRLIKRSLQRLDRSLSKVEAGIESLDKDMQTSDLLTNSSLHKSPPQRKTGAKFNYYASLPDTATTSRR